MKERPIVFSGEMVRAILEGRKTQTRRVVKPAPGKQSAWLSSETISRVHSGKMTHGGWQMFHPRAGTIHMGVSVNQDSPLGLISRPYGQPGDRLWVRETWARVHPAILQSLDPDADSHEWQTVYRADANGGYVGRMLDCTRWRPSIHMPRRASRITLEITGVRVERLQDISEEDAKAEGAGRGIYCEADDEGPALRSIDCESDERLASHRNGFRFIWECINGPDSWDANPWVWVINFHRVEAR